MKKIIILMLLASILISTISCGSEGGNPDVTTGGDDAATQEETTTYTYEYSKKYDGATVTILNAGDIYNMRAEIDREELTGDSLDDVMFNRCRKVENELNVKLEEHTAGVDGELANTAQKSIMSGEDEYSIMYIPARDLYKFTDGGYLCDLTTFPDIKLDKPWWSKSYNDSCTINGQLYAAVGASQLMYIDSLWCLFLNESMMADLGLDTPYDLVRTGKWTIDRLDEYMKAGAQLNGDESFNWNENGKSIYGLSGGAGDKFLAGCGEFIIGTKGGKLELDVGDSRFYEVTDKLSKVLKKNGGNRFSDPYSGIPDGTPGNYVTTFETQRALFLTAEVCKTSRMRDKSFEFGIVPFPKYDEGQENYYSNPFYGTPGFAIPVTAKDPERSAVVGDALAYLGNEMVLPVFIDVTLKGKGLRNENSVEMLELIINSSRADLCQIFVNEASAMRTAICTAMENGDGVASAIASDMSAVEAAIKAVNDK